ncbi:MAG: UDP-N-acetylmuramoyl-tripeptide--D-alanyl-D-alanine ligase [Bacteroidetes bacterium]|nr:UDP-N-acetylmuramoyl-tripeptide--D-alanyl-D-alanine ligase [Bacteroidota bacterium]
MIGTEALHARFLGTAGACTDTRALVPGGMFFALKGPSFDANAFAAQALDGGCACVVVDAPGVVRDERYLLVPDVLAALQDLARHHRRTFAQPVIAITGTNGKTTTKELVHAVLGADRPVLATAGNLNNHIGVPLTLLRLTPAHRIAVIEMGANKPGDIAELCAIAEPTHGLITNIGRAHLEGFGSYEGVIATKTELYADLRKRHGTAFVHADDPLLMDRSMGLRRVTYAATAPADTNGGTADHGPFLGVRFTGAQGGGPHTAHTQLIGAYNLPNALAAICIGQHFGVPDATIVRALEGYRPGNSRSQFLDTGRNHVVLDAYNANPSSMKAALENFAGIRTDRPKLAILGDMLELGAESAAEHQRIVDLLGTLGLEAMLVGPEFQRTSGDGPTRHASAQAALAALEQQRPEGRLLLVKGSRGIKLETVVPAL